MEIITSHNALDFDGLAAMVAAGKLYPGAVKVFSGTLSKNIRQFMALYKDLFSIKYPKEIDLKQVKRMIVVDTASANRLGHLKDLASQEGMDFYIYDHHPPAEDDLPASISEVEQVGAVTTLLVEKIIEREINLSAFDATILALGIYEDTGSLLFSSTTPRDISAAAFLLSRGANLSVVSNFMDQPFSGEQRQLLHVLLNSSRHYLVKNIDIVVATWDSNEFIPGLDTVTYRLLEIENCDVAFTVALMQGKVIVVGRSRTNNVKVNEVLRELKGRGHDRAASAVVKGQSLAEVVEFIMAELGKTVQPGLLARDIMSTPVKTIPQGISMEEAGRVMLRYGHTGMPVVEGEKMIGVISRRDVDKARIHDLGHAPVKGFMSSGVLSVIPDTPVGEIQRLMVEYDVGRLPVAENNRLLGIVSRTDILRTLHGEDYPEDHEVLYSWSGEETQNYLVTMQERMPSRLIATLRLAGELAEAIDSRAYCVGGFVRDFFLRVPNFDVDLVVEGDGEELARKMAQHLGGKARIHQRFRTAVLILPDGTKIDIATARTEYYEFPAALPKVEKASLREDMYRRDFTINTLAIALNPDSFGDLIDYFGGRKDLEKGLIRILYNFSFVEDPTRIIRAIRFEQRYQFNIEEDTLRFAKDAIERRLLGKLSYKRIIQELMLLLSEIDPLPALDRIMEIGVWEYIIPEIDLNKVSRTMIKRTPIIITWWEERYYGKKIKGWLAYLMVLLAGVDKEMVIQVTKRYHLDNYARKAIEESLQVPQMVEYLRENREILPGDMDRKLDGWSNESMILLLLSIRDELLWEKLVNYLDLKERIKVEINGYDLKEMGLKQGPEFRFIFDELYQQKLNGVIKSREGELQTVKKWMMEGKYNNDPVAE
ncbi:MAG: CBS domain-containing protein [Syntrophomonas sp.]|uniref:CBS domain-containing protein n=1 Tax=Syntrophomonas sp. TaxID=2053627 RepID=UPI00263662FC|nr:CBS domain-containing protein [Syntrophomonas sp.]MDD2510651.1 CBS domain-containing protein [Syntrophomonas sp.]MDD3879705.1 CBS domain-containing protein [Syntrophomonas sp.]MDD4626805.1 CBS domain-containing protein [Syntrophomonas sp.]